jgi:Uma2 family endonuclease
MTFSKYLNYEAPRDFRDELIHGEIELSPSGNADHSAVCERLFELLKPILHGSNFDVHLDTTMHINEEEGPRPDVFIIDKQRWRTARARRGYPEGSPNLVIEVRSPSNTDEELAQRRTIYFSDPRCEEFWIVDPEQRCVQSYRNPKGLVGELSVVLMYEPSSEGDSVPLPTSISSSCIQVGEIFVAD